MYISGTKLSSVGGGRQLRLSELDASLFLASGRSYKNFGIVQFCCRSEKCQG